MKIFNFAICTLLLSALVACHSDKDDAPLQKGLHYTDNASAKGDSWRVVVASGNGTSELVLKVMGPVGIKTRGTAFTFTADPAKVEWAIQKGAPATANHIQLGKALQLGAGPFEDVQMVKSHVDAAKGELQAGVFQKYGVSALANEPLAYISLKLKADAPKGLVTLTASSKCMHLKGDEKAVAPETVKFLLGTLEHR